VLTGQAMVRDAGSENARAQRLLFFQSTGGHRSRGAGALDGTFAAKRRVIADEFCAGENLSADHMRANSKTGRAVYTGHARFVAGGVGVGKPRRLSCCVRRAR